MADFASAESCEIHQWASRRIQGRAGSQEPLRHLRRTAECSGCFVCEAALEIARAQLLAAAVHWRTADEWTPLRR